ncbi:ubiquinol-cytochrome c reductase complex assembly factor 1 [Calliopsis andreniformis]|uniref:ubiquinol-cytochrome c reductase complex assembly factor 1 n=1 Tax=Calliopsis andreniformis TaxID=337506 RepID=UPI003FCC389C
MHCVRMLTLRKASLSSVLKHAIERQYVANCIIEFNISHQLRQFSENAKVKDLSDNVNSTKNKDGLFIKLLRKVGIHKEKYQLMSLGYFLYEDIIDRVNYSVFFKDFKMPDTFYSWFLVTELHVWMLMVRLMAEGEPGKTARNNLVEALWNDVDARVNKLGPIHPRIKKKQLMDLSGQFNAALIDYDEGILSEDRVLAGALWRRFFCSECNNPEQIERLLIYVRKQINLLDKIPPEEVLFTKKIEWVDIRNVR